MANRLFIIFSDFDGVEARVSTWGNDTAFAKACNRIGCPEMRDLDIYAFNRIDRLCRCFGEEDKVWLVSTSCWKNVFDKWKNRQFITKWAGLKKVQIVKKNRKSFDRISSYEPYTRFKLIRWYLNTYKPDGFVILDDSYGSAFRNEFGDEHFIETDRADGITFNHYIKLRSIIATFTPPTVSAEREKAFQTLLASI